MRPNSKQVKGELAPSQPQLCKNAQRCVVTMRRSVISSASSGEALLLSAITAGAQLSQPQQTSIFAPRLPLWRDGQAAAFAPVRAQGSNRRTVTAAIDAHQRGDRAE